MSENKMLEKWTPMDALSREAYATLWERAATHVLLREDQGEMNPTMENVWSDMHNENPDLYPPRAPAKMRYGWFHDPDFREYLALRRQEHYIRTMPARSEIRRYHAKILEMAGSELVRRLHEAPDSISNRDLLQALRSSTQAVAALEGDINIAQGEQTGNQLQVNVFQFLEKAPPERREVLAAALAKRGVPQLNGSNGD